MKNSAIGKQLEDVRTELFTKEKSWKVICGSRYDGADRARHERALVKETRRTGRGQSTGHRSRMGKTSPQLDTVLKVLASLGKTLAVVPRNRKGLKRNPEKYYGNNTTSDRSTKPCGAQRTCSGPRWMRQ